MTKLPRKLKSGRRLVATAAEGRVGLYCLGTPKTSDANYAVLLPSGKVKRGMLGSQGYPIPPEGRWAWLGKKRQKKAKKPREVRIEETHSEDMLVIPTISATCLCVDCERDVRERKHSHTAMDAGLPIALCCRCARRRGGRCGIHEKARRRRLRRRRSR